MADKFLARIGGRTQQRSAVDTSSGAGDAGRIPALGSDGKLDESMMPVGIGADVHIIEASEPLSAGVYVNVFSDSGVVKVRLADNSNGRAADGFVLDAVASDADATVYPLDATNSELTGLEPGASYWLGTAGGVIPTALDATSSANANKICQKLGKAISETELVTTDDGYVVL